MTIYDWISIGLACFIGAASPGPSMLVIIYINSTKGLLSAIIASIGHGIGIFIYAIATALGMKYFLIQFPNALLFIKVFGILFLFFISFKMLFFKIENTNVVHSKTFVQNYNSFNVGTLVALINPKIILFFGAVFSQFIKNDFNFNDKFLISILAAFIDTLWYVILAVSSHYFISSYFKKYKRRLVNSFGLLLILTTLIIIKNNFFVS